MLVPEHDRFYRRILEHVDGTVLMLGNQKVCYKHPFPSYTTLDPDGGDWQEDLSSLERFPQYQNIINIGTTEHIWDIHGAYCNIARLLFKGGIYAGSTPCSGYNRHGIHTTRSQYIRGFFRDNGFEIRDEWFTNRRDEISQPEGDTLYWLVAQKVKTVTTFKKPQQIFSGGRFDRIG